MCIWCFFMCFLSLNIHFLTLIIYSKELKMWFLDYDKCMFCFVRNWQCPLCSYTLFAFLSAMREPSFLLHVLTSIWCYNNLTILIVILFYSPYYYFHFSGNIECEASFYIIICYLYILIGEMILCSLIILCI